MPEPAVTSLELSRNLKEAGYPQEESYWVWVKLGYNAGGDFQEPLPNGNTVSWKREVRRDVYNIEDREWFAALSVAELGESLPADFKYNGGVGWKTRPIIVNHYWPCKCCGQDSLQEKSIEWEVSLPYGHRVKAPTEAEARGLMALWLLENGYGEVGDE